MRLPKIISYHLRLWIALLAGIVVFFVTPTQGSMVSRVLISWNIGTWLFLILVFTKLSRLTATQLRSKYQDEDESAPVILLIVTVSAILSLVAIVALLSTIKHAHGGERVEHIVLAATTLVGSWLLVPTMFAVHYADHFYSAKPSHRPLNFPETPQPVFWDFVYFSFTIAAACQTADVSTTQLPIRKLVTFHTILSFLFNASILGFAINVSAGLISGD